MDTPNFSRRFLSIIAVMSLAAATGCSDSDDPVVEPLPTVQAKTDVRVIHTSPDAPPVNILLNGAIAIPELDYAQSSGFANIDAGTYDISVEGIIPGGNASVIDLTGVELAESARTTVLAVGKVASIEPLIVSESAGSPAANEVSVAVVHAAPEAPAVDIFVSAVDAPLDTLSPVTTLAFKESADAGSLAAGEVRIRATAGGALVYDSGTVDLAPFASQKLLIAAIASTNAAELEASPVKLLVSTDSTAVVVRDTATSVGLKVIHASPDAGVAAAGPVEVFATSEALTEFGDTAVELIPSFSYQEYFPAADEYAFVPAGSYVVDVAPDSDTVGDSVFTSPELTLNAASEFTIVASGRVTTAPDFDLLVTEDKNRAVATEARVKVIHAAPAAGTVDVFVTSAGDFSGAEVAGGLAGDPLLDEFTFGTITDYVSVAPGDYDIRVVANGAVAINIENFALSGGLVANVVARGPIEPNGDPADFSVLLTTN